MKTLIAALGGIAMLATGIAATATPAEARDGYYRHHGGYYDGGRRWRHHRGHRDALAAGAIGLGVGTIIGGALAAPRYYNDGYIVNEGPVYQPRRYYRPAPVYRGGYSHVDACYARYRSYDPRSDTYIGYDGRAHRCRL